MSSRLIFHTFNLEFTIKKAFGIKRITIKCLREFLGILITYNNEIIKAILTRGISSYSEKIKEKN